jgi:hypothetical protein
MRRAEQSAFSPMGTRGTLVVAAAAAVIGGCGASDRAPDATAVAERFHDAIGRQDGEAACADLAEETASKLEQQQGRPCPEAILDLDLPRGATTAHTTVYVTTASVTLADGGTAFLDESESGWEISAAGCVPTAPDLPYDCELEG